MQPACEKYNEPFRETRAAMYFCKYRVSQGLGSSWFFSALDSE